MKTKWGYFIGAAILAAFFLLRAGVPFQPVLAGIGGAALFMRHRMRTA